MKRSQAETIVKRNLKRVMPEADLSNLTPEQSLELSQQVDIMHLWGELTAYDDEQVEKALNTAQKSFETVKTNIEKIAYLTKTLAIVRGQK